MGYYNYLCELLRPLRVYRLDEGSLSGAELYAAGEGLDAAAEALEKAVREGVLMTAEDEGLSRRERLFSRVGARTTPALRRLAIASLLRVGGDGFTLESSCFASSLFLFINSALCASIFLFCSVTKPSYISFLFSFMLVCASNFLAFAASTRSTHLRSISTNL